MARLEWEKFESRSLEAVREEYERVKDESHTRLHLDHVPVVDEDGLRVDYESLIARAIAAGYQSVMVDGSRLPFEENMTCTRRVVEMAREAGIPVEAELGAVLGHEDGPAPSYEDVLARKLGFTRVDKAGDFVARTGVDWLSVAIGNLHGAISAAARGKEKIQARLDIAHLRQLKEAAACRWCFTVARASPRSRCSRPRGRASPRSTWARAFVSLMNGPSATRPTRRARRSMTQRSKLSVITWPLREWLNAFWKEWKHEFRHIRPCSSETGASSRSS